MSSRLRHPDNGRMDIVVGANGTAGLVVSAADTAVALGSGDVDVLGTPRLVALCEAATVAALAGGLAATETSVGTRVEVDHLAPSLPGARIEARAILAEVDRRRLVFEVEAREGDHVIGRGRITRVVVDRDRFAKPSGPVDQTPNVDRG